jgi:putative restriction endonuclease
MGDTARWDRASIDSTQLMRLIYEKRSPDSSTKKLALSKKHHWAFDHGWFGVDDDYRIVIPWERFKEEAAVESRGMMQFKGEQIELPREERFMPSLEGLRWHRERWEVVK